MAIKSFPLTCSHSVEPRATWKTIFTITTTSHWHTLVLEAAVGIRWCFLLALRSFPSWHLMFMLVRCFFAEGGGWKWVFHRLEGFHIWYGKFALFANIRKHLSIAKRKWCVPPNSSQTRQPCVPSAPPWPVLMLCPSDRPAALPLEVLCTTDAVLNPVASWLSALSQPLLTLRIFFFWGGKLFFNYR